MIPGVGPAASAAINIFSKPGGAIRTAVTKGRIGAKAVQAAIIKHPALSAAGAAGAITGATAAHKAYMRRLPRDVAGPGAIGGDPFRRRRRMNPCNPRALRRAIRRTHSFAKLAMKTIHLVHPKKKARFGGFRKKRSK
jgi:hypothetical protein